MVEPLRLLLSWNWNVDERSHVWGDATGNSLSDIWEQHEICRARCSVSLLVKTLHTAKCSQMQIIVFNSKAHLRVRFCNSWKRHTYKLIVLIESFSFSIHRRIQSRFWQLTYHFLEQLPKKWFSGRTIFLLEAFVNNPSLAYFVLFMDVLKSVESTCVCERLAPRFSALNVIVGRASDPWLSLGNSQTPNNWGQEPLPRERDRLSVGVSHTPLWSYDNALGYKMHFI